MKLILAILLLSIQYSFAQQKIGSTVDLKDSIQWEAYDTTSMAGISQITPAILEGKWKSYKGAYLFNNKTAGMQLTTPIILVIKRNEFKRNSKGPFEQYTLENNRIIGHDDPSTDVGVINLITPHSLVISWKMGSNYTRYYYER